MSQDLAAVSSAPHHPWPGLEVRHLTALEAVGREGSFHGAADALGYVQSAVSQQIATLERVVGERLVERRRGQRGVTLTTAGDLMVTHGADIVRRLHAARSDLAELCSAAPAKLRVGVDQLLAPRLLPPLMAELERRNGSMRVELSDLAGSAELAHRVGCGELDVAIGDVPPTGLSVTSEALLEDRCVLVVNADSPLANGAGPPSLRDLAGVPLVAVLSAHSVDQLQESASEAGLEIEIAVQTRAAAVGWTFANRDLGAAIGQRLALDLPQPGVAVLDLDGMVPPQVVALSWHRDRVRTGAIESFRTVAETALAAATRWPRVRMNGANRTNGAR